MLVVPCFGSIATNSTQLPRACWWFNKLVRSWLQEGKIVEQGTHKDLYARESSVYHSLVKLQEQAMDKRANADEAGAATDADEVALTPAGAAVATPSGKDRASGMRSQRKSLDLKGPQGEKTGLPGDEKKEDELVRMLHLIALQGHCKSVASADLMSFCAAALIASACMLLIAIARGQASAHTASARACAAALAVSSNSCSAE